MKYCNFCDFEIIKKSYQGTILKACDHKGRLFAIKIDKKPSSVSSSSKSTPFFSSISHSVHLPSMYLPLSYSLLTTSSSISPPLIVKGDQKKEKEFLIDLQGIRGIPIFFGGGFDPEIKRFVNIEELTGRNLKYYFTKLRKFSVDTTLKIALQLFKILRGIHERGIIHRDLQPSNLALSQNGRDIMLLDFCLARRLTWKAKKNKEPKSQRKFVGDLRFCGLNAHSFKNDTKVDDLVSLGILIIYFLQGSLTWDYRESSNFSKSAEKIWLKKVNFICNELPTLYPLLYPYFKYLFSVKHDSINYDYLVKVIETWAKFEQVDIESETWEWSEIKDERDSFDRDYENEEKSMENFHEEFGETMVSELMINYRVPKL